ncbi:TPA: DUF4910 domain-containing protein [Campylobacter jejuni]|nr:DUF4910 domain-containing protein [Campylobacter jejuni]HED9894896.1 DUF4910 domain-containing protein [Campylobacter jejuni]
MNKLDFRSQDFSRTGKAMYELACELFPIPRSITGQGFRDSLEILNKTLGGGGDTQISLYKKWHKGF